MALGLVIAAACVTAAIASYMVNACSSRPQKRVDSRPASPPGGAGGVFVIREGEAIAPGEAWYAWMSEDMDRMLAALDGPATPVDRHFLFMRIVQQAYKRREADLEMRALCVRMARKHVEEFDDIIEPLKREFGLLPRVPTFQHLATVLTEAGEFDEAISVCEAALSYGLDDGTKGGFAGRIERIRKKGRIA